MLLQEKKRTVHTAIHDLKAPLNATYSILDYSTEKTWQTILSCPSGG